MKWNIFYTLRGPGGTLEAPNKENPVEADSISGVLIRIGSGLSEGKGLFGMLEILGVRIEKVEP